MSSEDVTKWTCDRCGRESTTQGRAFPPEGWRRFAETELDPESDDQASWDLCDGCTYQTEHFLEPTNGGEPS